MTNREWLMNEMQNMSDAELVKTIYIPKKMEEERCKKFSCGGGVCSVCKTNWLKAEHKEPIKLSDAERVILENVDKEFEWISRDKDESLYVSKVKPSKDYEIWQGGESEPYVFYNHLFQFITWEDTEAYNIEELLKGK